MCVRAHFPKPSSTCTPPAESCLRRCPKLSCDNVRLHHVHEVRYSDLDVNNHVNNVRAVELISDALDLYKQPGFVSELQVNYTRPKPPAANRFRC